VISSLLFGLAPALRAARTDAHDILKGSRSGSMAVARDRLRQTLIAAEVALALVLLIGSGLLIRTALALQQVDIGFDTNGILSARVFLPTDGYAEPARVAQTFERLADEVRRIPGVTSAAVGSQVPLDARGNSNGLIPEGRPLKVESVIDSVFRLITPEYLQTMRIPLKRGRAFTADDRAGGQKVMIVSEALARQAWPGQDPIGKRIACCESGPDGKTPSWKVVIGVAGDVHTAGPANPPVPEFYLPVEQAPRNAWDWIRRTMFIVARTSATQPQDTSVTAMIAPMRQAIARIDPSLPLFDIQSMDQRLDGVIATRRFNMALLTTLGVVGGLLAAIGIYGVIAYFVSQRTQEIGVRLALGASPRDVLTLVVRQALRPVLFGIAGGMALALFAAKLLESQLFGVAPRDPLTLVGVAMALVVVAIVASLVPARRAARVDPTRALNQ
jgi:putative ABC transport system permease protein